MGVGRAMSNRIRRIDVIDQAISPAECSLRVVVTPERVGPTTEIRGRFMGPRCLFASTVEVAYPLRRQPGLVNPGELAARVVVPEASLWEPQSPFLYQGPIELWEGGERLEVVQIRHGFRVAALGPRGLRVNGRPAAPRGRMVEKVTEEEARRMRQEDVDLWIVPVRESCLRLWDLADEVGFFIVGQIEATTEAALIQRIESHASHFGWLWPDKQVLGSARGFHGAMGNAEMAVQGWDFLVVKTDEVNGVALRFLA